MADKLREVIAAPRAEGFTSAKGIARELTRRGIGTPRGKATWTATRVARVLGAGGGEARHLDVRPRHLDVRRGHPAVTGRFHQGFGPRLQRHDSDLALAVLARLRKQGIAALPVHDSFVVPARRRCALEEAMDDELTATLRRLA